METVKSASDEMRAAKISYIIGIGASAGGLEAINAFFKNVPENCGLSFVLIQHLSPDYKSMMPELLAKHTRLTISRATNDTVLRPNCVYTIPADKNITLSKGRLHLESREGAKTLNLPINIFFKSLAADVGDKAVAVILSGTGSDGMLGVESIKQKGGMVIAQDPLTAAFDSMPKSAISTGLVDFILPPSKMPKIIEKFIKEPNALISQIEQEKEMISSDEGGIIDEILQLIYKKTNFDFRRYKRATIFRRIERRLNMNGIPNFNDYYELLKDNTKELNTLAEEMLIGVTSFFRDTKAFMALDDVVLKTLVKKQSKDLRIWVLACSTGQEAYTLAIMIKEQMVDQNKNINVKIFATDVNQGSVDFASRGSYFTNLMEGVSEELRKKYFKFSDGRYEIKKVIRDMVIFARHDIVKDPPFNNIDLVTCRNMLIYFESDIQEKILSFIHYSLRENGYLFLGSSENTGSYSKIFAEIDKKYKIFQNVSSIKIGEINKLYPLVPRKEKLGTSNLNIDSEVVTLGVSKTKMVNNFKDVLLEDLVFPSVIINEKDEVVHVAGEIDKYIKLPKKHFTLNVFKMVNENLYVTLSNIVSKAKNENSKVTSPIINSSDGESEFLEILVKPYFEPLSRVRYFIITFKETMVKGDFNGHGKYNSVSADYNHEKDAYIKRLEEDLGETKDYLQTTIEELETSNEELQSTNEELMAANEELQSSNEELQSVNEELYTVNNEFQDKLDEMSGLNDDLQNFIHSTNIATLFLDNEFCIRRFTNELLPYIKVTPSDIGRYVGDFTHTFGSLKIIDIAKKVLEHFLPIEKEVMALGGKTFLMRATLYKTTKKEIKGVIFTFIDISQIKEIETELNAQTKELARSNRELEQFAYVASHDLKAPITNLEALLDALKRSDSIKENGMALFKRLYTSVSNMNSTIRTLNEVIAIKKSLDLKSEHISIDKVLTRVEEGISNLIESSETRIVRNFSENDKVYFPELHLHSILQNLITNAIKYRKANLAPKLIISSFIKEDEVCITVKDNGRGMDMAIYRDKLFGLFQRFHLDTEGKGIGLHITKSILESYGGRIEVESAPGKGATFFCFFQVRAS
ncbi:chemotaxis protein CheB [Pseudozobellia sp. WGM2]|uniref:chemotaxis protein CheB n=1 Tax=Pseudozobellia sp. WGM2 TaxID=2787625 RepID=UPI001ADF5F13|nr:chemotaxis protein CheB [Pseudozobellia sp. WGM2]